MFILPYKYIEQQANDIIVKYTTHASFEFRVRGFEWTLFSLVLLPHITRIPWIERKLYSAREEFLVELRIRCSRVLEKERLKVYYPQVDNYFNSGCYSCSLVLEPY